MARKKWKDESMIERRRSQQWTWAMGVCALINLAKPLLYLKTQLIQIFLGSQVTRYVFYINEQIFDLLIYKKNLFKY